MAREVKIGNVKIGAGNPVLVQSMTNTLTKDSQATIRQISELEKLGCEIIRVAVPDMESAKALKEIKENINIPLVADIHFDYKLAIESAKFADKLRINPGNIGSEEKIKLVIDAAKEHSLPIRIGVNLGSLEKDIEAKYGLTPLAMVESAKKHIGILEKHNFNDIVVSLKASDVLKTIKANILFSEQFDYPLHIGITESGSANTGNIKSSIGIGHLLLKGIGDTIRVSLSEDPKLEVPSAWAILKALKLRKRGIDITACPTCARSEYDVSRIVKELEEKTANITTPLHIALMGCAVNGPGEAREADIGVAGAKPDNLFYKDGKVIGRVKEEDIIKKIMDGIINIG